MARPPFGSLRATCLSSLSRSSNPTASRHFLEEQSEDIKKSHFQDVYTLLLVVDAADLRSTTAPIHSPPIYRRSVNPFTLLAKGLRATKAVVTLGEEIEGLLGLGTTKWTRVQYNAVRRTCFAGVGMLSLF
jgi:hypothetical protein